VRFIRVPDQHHAAAITRRFASVVDRGRTHQAMDLTSSPAHRWEAPFDRSNTDSRPHRWPHGRAVIVVRVRAEFELLETNSLDELCMACPAIADEKLLIRMDCPVRNRCSYCWGNSARIRPASLGSMVAKPGIPRITCRIRSVRRRPMFVSPNSM
jgi:hypothetical protein